MATLQDTDIKRPSERTYITDLDADDVIVTEDVSAELLKPITKTNLIETLGINAKADNTDLTALGGRVTTAEGEIDALETEVDNNNLYARTELQSLDDKYKALVVKYNSVLAEQYTDTPILSYSQITLAGEGYESDDTPIDIKSTVVDGSLDLEQSGLTITNLVDNGKMNVDSNSDGVADNWIKTVLAPTCTVSSEGQKLAVDVSMHVGDRGVEQYSQNAKAGDILQVFFKYKFVNTRYTSPRVRIYFYDSSDSVISNEVTGALSESAVFTSNSIRVTCPANTAYVRFVPYIRSSADLDSVGEITYTDFAPYNLTALGLDHITDTAILAKLLPYVDGTQNVGKMGLQILDADDNVTQTIFLPAIGNSLPNGTADSIKTVADGWEHTKRVERCVLQASDVESIIDFDIEGYTEIVRTRSYILSLSGSTFPSAQVYIPYKLYVSKVEERSLEKNIGNYSLTSLSRIDFLVERGKYDGYISQGYNSALEYAQADLAGTVVYYQLATPITTHYDLPLPTSGNTIHRFAGEEKIALYGTGLTFSENVLSVLKAIKFVSGEMTDITDDAVLSGTGVTFSGVGATDVVHVKVRYNVDKPIGTLEYVPPVENTASRLTDLESRVTALEAV